MAACTMSMSVATRAVRPAARGMRVSCKAAATTGKTVVDVKEAVKNGLIGAVAPFPEGLDVGGFLNGADEATINRYREAELTHGRVAMLASVGFLVGEQVEGSGFLFDAQVTGPAINHFQQVPPLFWGLLGAFIFGVEATRVQRGWANPFEADKLFLLRDDYTPGDLDFDPLGLGKNKTPEELVDLKVKELNNGRLAMIAISGMVAQELVNGLNIIPADEVLEMGKAADLMAMEKTCTGQLDEAACAKAFEAAERAANFAANYSS